MDTNSPNQNNQPKPSVNPMLIGAAVLGVLLIGGYVLFAKKGNDSEVQVPITQTPENSRNTVSEPPPITETPTQGSVKEFTMTAKKFEFSPAKLVVSEGDRIKLTIQNLDVPHGFAIDELGVKKDLAAGETTVVEFTASKKGTFRFYCSLYCGQGHREMEGEIIVE